MENLTEFGSISVTGLVETHDAAIQCQSLELVERRADYDSGIH